jgi:hypothetical protein
MFFGTVPVSQLGSDGRLTTGAVTVYHDAVEGLQDTLNTFAASVPSDSGLCIASRAGDVLYVADVQGIGRGVDTQRRRREKLQEVISYDDLPQA